MEYSEEEKKAIDYLENLDIDFNTLSRINLRDLDNCKKVILNLIEKQQKEIERLEKTIDENIVIEPDETGCHEELNIHIKDFIPKEVIRNKIKDYDNEIEDEFKKCKNKAPTLALNILTFTKDEFK